MIIGTIEPGKFTMAPKCSYTMSMNGNLQCERLAVDTGVFSDQEFFFDPGEIFPVVNNK